MSRPRGVGAWLLISGHYGGEALDPESPPTKYPKHSQYKYAKSRNRVRDRAKYEAGLQKLGDMPSCYQGFGKGGRSRIRTDDFHRGEMALYPDLAVAA